MYKKYLLKCSVLNEYTNQYRDENYYFDYIGEVVYFIKNGNGYVKPEHIRVEAVFKLDEVDIGEFLK